MEGVRAVGALNVWDTTARVPPRDPNYGNAGPMLDFTIAASVALRPPLAFTGATANHGS